MPRRAQRTRGKWFEIWTTFHSPNVSRCDRSTRSTSSESVQVIGCFPTMKTELGYLARAGMHTPLDANIFRGRFKYQWFQKRDASTRHLKG
jgi:hypothetical protein